jgi:co-chaperonin GroES (HSP10)
MNLKCTGTRYIIESVELNKTTSFGLVLQHSMDTQFATILVAGPEVKDPLPLGTKVVVEWNHTWPIKWEDKTYHIVDTKSVIAVVEE